MPDDQTPPTTSGHLWTGKGDDGTTGLYYGGRVAKDAPEPEALGAVDEAQAALGVARAGAAVGSDLHDVLSEVCGHLYVAMAELATAPANQAKLVDGRSRVTAQMVARLEVLSDETATRFPPLTDFVVPGQTPIAAELDLARTIVRRAERRAVAVAHGLEGSHLVGYLNRLSTLVWALARAEEATHQGSLRSKEQVAGEAGHDPAGSDP